MAHLPVVVGFGGINAAGRSSFHQGYRRLVIDALAEKKQAQTLLELGRLMRLAPQHDDHTLLQNHCAEIYRHTLIRRIERSYFDVDAMPLHHAIKFSDRTLTLSLRPRDLPENLPANWQIVSQTATSIEVTIHDGLEALIPTTQAFPVSSAGQVPSGFDPAAYYPSRHHPRALQLTVFGASDALHSIGIPWEQLRQKTSADRIAVYASSAHGQLDDYGAGGMLKSLWQGKRNTAKQCPLGFAEMPADFINAYILGNMGPTAGTLGACATFLYNLERAVTDIRDGRIDFAVVGAAEAPILPEVMEGYRVMGALGEDHKLLELDRAKNLHTLDNSRATRPFGYNAGFTMAESAQFIILSSDRFALEQGLPIHGSVPGVFVHADGYKKSITAPGIGNYFSFGKAVALAKEILGEEKLQRASYIQAHGTGTPQNRVTESHIFDSIADAFGIRNWLVSSIKCYVGHSLGAAAGDQCMAALGAWSEGIIPGIFTLDEIAHDVHQKNLHFSQRHIEEASDAKAACFINSKGFGGNNATALLISPQQTLQLLKNRHGQSAITAWQHALAPSHEGQEKYQALAEKGQYHAIYHFGENVLDGTDLQINAASISLPGHEQSVTLSGTNYYSAYREKSASKKE